MNSAQSAEPAVTDGLKAIFTCLSCPHMQSVMLDDIRWSGWCSKLDVISRAHIRAEVDVYVNGISYRTGIPLKVHYKALYRLIRDYSSTEMALR